MASTIEELVETAVAQLQRHPEVLKQVAESNLRQECAMALRRALERNRVQYHPDAIARLKAVADLGIAPEIVMSICEADERQPLRVTETVCLLMAMGFGVRLVPYDLNSGRLAVQLSGE